MAEYEALLNGLRMALELGIQRLEIKGDLRLIVDQVMKESGCLDPKMATYCQVVRKLEDKLDGLELVHIPRHLNEAADALAKMGSKREPVSTAIFASDQHEPSIRHVEDAHFAAGTPGEDAGAPPPTPTLLDPNTVSDEDGGQGPTLESPDLGSPKSDPGAQGSAQDSPASKVMELDEGSGPEPDPATDWREPYLKCLLDGELPADKTEARWLARQAKSFVLVGQ